MNERADIERELDEARQLLAEMHEDRKDLEHHVGEMEKELDGIQDEIDHQNNEIAALEAELAELPLDSSDNEYQPEESHFGSDE